MSKVYSNRPATPTVYKPRTFEPRAGRRGACREGLSLMKWYHGSTLCIPKPQLLPVTRRLDFGSGFYVTSNEEQARNWARIKKRRQKEALAVVSIYDGSAVMEAKNLHVLRFREPNESWLDFVMLNRMGLDIPRDGAEVIFGPVANDTLYETLALYERSLLSREETIVRLRTQKLADQICLRSQAAIDLLKFKSCVEVEVAQ